MIYSSVDFCSELLFCRLDFDLIQLTLAVFRLFVLFPYAQRTICVDVNMLHLGPDFRKIISRS